MFRRWNFGFVTKARAALNKTGRALGCSNNSIVMKGWGISCASSSSSSSSVGVFLSLVLSEASASGWWPKIAPSAGTLAQFTTLGIQPGAGRRRAPSAGFPPRSQTVKTRPYLPHVRNPTPEPPLSLQSLHVESDGPKAEVCDVAAERQLPEV